MKYINKQTGDEIEAIQWFGNNLTEVLNFIHVKASGTMTLKISKQDYFFIHLKHGKVNLKVKRGDWVFYAEGKPHAWNTEMFKRIFDENL